MYSHMPPSGWMGLETLHLEPQVCFYLSFYYFNDYVQRYIAYECMLLHMTTPARANAMLGWIFFVYLHSELLPRHNHSHQPSDVEGCCHHNHMSSYVVTVFYIYFCLTEHLYTLRPCCYTSPPLLACKCNVGLILFVLFAHGTAAMSATNRTMTKGHHYQYHTPLPMGQTKRTTPWEKLQAKLSWVCILFIYYILY